MLGGRKREKFCPVGRGDTRNGRTKQRGYVQEQKGYKNGTRRNRSGGMRRG